MGPAGQPHQLAEAVSRQAGRWIKSESTADGRLLPLATGAQGETLAGSRRGQRRSWGQSPAIGRRRGDAAHQGELGGGRDGRL
jgi:hypothetical protein